MVSEVQLSYRGQSLPGAPRLDVAKLTGAAGAAFAAASGLEVLAAGRQAPRGATRYALRVSLEIGALEDQVTKRGNLRALVRAQLAPLEAAAGAQSFAQTALAEHAFTVGAPGQPNWQGHATRAVRDCVTLVGARVKLASGDAAAILAALDGKSADLQKEAIHLAAERRLRAAVPPLLRQLHSSDGALRDAAIGALAAIGDERAVRPLTEVAKFNDLTDLPKVLDALAAIGGPEARAYLAFVASGHESAEMRILAQKALGHLERRAQQAAATPQRYSSPITPPSGLRTPSR